jgi:S1-C subfamily serine protease
MEAARRLPPDDAVPDAEPGDAPARSLEPFAIAWNGSPLQKVSSEAGARDPEEIAIAARAARAALEDARTASPSPVLKVARITVPVVAAIVATVLVLNAVGSGGGLDAERLSARLAPSMVRIEVGEVRGSGFVLDSTRSWTLVVTNHHVVAEAPVGMTDGAGPVLVVGDRGPSSAWVRWTDPDDDLAFLLVKGEMPAVRLASEGARQGQPVATMGYPLGGGFSVTLGNISTIYTDAIQYSAVTNPGNSGGALVDARGRVVGVTSAKLVGEAVEGIAFAIPISVVCDALDAHVRAFNVARTGAPMTFRC